MALSRKRKLPTYMSPMQARLQAGLKRYYANRKHGIGLTYSAASSVANMAIIYFGIGSVGPKHTFLIVSLLAAFQIVGALVFTLLARRANQHIRNLNSTASHQDRIPEPDRLWRGY